MEKLLTVKDVCKMLGISDTTIRRWIKEKKLPCYKIGNEYKFFESELMDFILKNRVNQS